MKLSIQESGGRRIAICIFLTLATLVVYAQALGHDFVNYDDGKYITDNRNVQEGFSGDSIVWAFTATHASNWHPLTWLSHMLDHRIYGLNPAGHHLTNLLLHIANTLLLFLALERMTGAQWQSGFVAAMFALHPLNVESVAWAAERKSALSAFFWMLTMGAYVRYVEKPGAARYCWTILFFALGLMAKPMLVTLPLALLLLDYWPLRRLKSGANFFRRLREKIPLLILVAGSCTITFIAQKTGGAVHPTDINSLPVRLNNAMVSYLEYLRMMLWPAELTVFYPHPGDALPAWKGAACAAALACVSAAVVRAIRRTPYLAVGWFWFLGTLVPMIGIIQVGDQAMADRYAYIPLVGIFIAAAWGVPGLLGKWRYKNQALAVSAGALISALMATAWTQAGYWENSVKLFQHAIESTGHEYPAFVHARNNMGLALSEQGKFEEAAIHYRKAIALNPEYAKAYNNLGNALSEMMRLEEAIAHYQKALALEPGYHEAHNNLGNALGRQGKLDEAIAHYKESIKLRPGFAEAHHNLASALARQGYLEEAIERYRESIRLNPNLPMAHNNLADSLGQQGNFAEAASHYREAITLDPGFAEAHNGLGSALGQMGNLEEAIVHFKQALAINPGLDHARANLETALSMTANANADNR